MPEFDLKSHREANMPDWAFDTDEDLRAHAFEMIGDTAEGLREQDEDPDRPEGALAATVVSIPCANSDNITRQVVYLGFCAQACQELGLVVRQSQAQYYPDLDQAFASLLVCTADGLTRALVEAAAEDHPERSSRTH